MIIKIKKGKKENERIREEKCELCFWRKQKSSIYR